MRTVGHLPVPIFHFNNLIAGSIIASELERLQDRYPSIKTILLDVTKDEEKLRELILSSDLVISLLTNEMQEPVS